MTSRPSLVVGALMAFVLCAAGIALACQTANPASPEDIPKRVVKGADLIVRVTALDDTGIARVRFRVEEILKGSDRPTEVILPGSLTQGDDWNKQRVPYIRGRGFGGPCFTDQYRRGGQFLLMLKRKSNESSTSSSPGTEYSTRWYVGPVNEQIRFPDDPWLAWVRDQLTASAGRG